MARAARARIYFSEDEYEVLDRAAYWEGFKSVSAFVSAVMRHHIEDREKLRGSRYAEARWKPDEGNEADDPGQ